MGHAGQRLTRRHLHPEQELDLPAGLVEDVGHTVAVFGNPQRAVGQPIGLAATPARRPLPGAEQLVRGDSAVDDVLAVVARVVPATAHVEPVVADPFLARHVGVALVRFDAEVTCRSGVLLPDQRAVDLDPTAVDVEELQGVRSQLFVHLGGDVERIARLAVGRQRVTLARLAEGAEVDRLHVLSRRLVDPAGS